MRIGRGRHRRVRGLRGGTSALVLASLGVRATPPFRQQQRVACGRSPQARRSSARIQMDACCGRLSNAARVARARRPETDATASLRETLSPGRSNAPAGGRRMKWRGAQHGERAGRPGGRCRGSAGTNPSAPQAPQRGGSPWRAATAGSRAAAWKGPQARPDSQGGARKPVLCCGQLRGAQPEVSASSPRACRFLARQRGCCGADLLDVRMAEDSLCRRWSDPAEATSFRKVRASWTHSRPRRSARPLSDSCTGHQPLPPVQAAATRAHGTSVPRWASAPWGPRPPRRAHASEDEQLPWEPPCIRAIRSRARAGARRNGRTVSWGLIEAPRICSLRRANSCSPALARQQQLRWRPSAASPAGAAKET